MSTEPLSATSGYYGKVPALGDFIRHNLPRSFIEPWDDWLQSAIASSKNQLENNWLDKYLTSPVYRFVLTPGICGESGWAGLLMPSVDRVGRYFPLTLSKPVDPQENPFLVFAQNTEWFNQAENLILTMLEDEFSTIKFNDLLSELESIPSEVVPYSEQHLDEQEIQCEILAIRNSLDKAEDLSDLCPSLLNTVLKEVSFAYSLWWTAGSEIVDPSFLVSQGLPPAANLSALFDGNWEQWGWQDEDPNPDKKMLPIADLDDDEPWAQ